MNARHVPASMAVLVLLASVSPARAQVPELIHYQGILADAGGTPIESPGLSMIFRIASR